MKIRHPETSVKDYLAIVHTIGRGTIRRGKNSEWDFTHEWEDKSMLLTEEGEEILSFWIDFGKKLERYERLYGRKELEKLIEEAKKEANKK